MSEVKLINANDYEHEIGQPNKSDQKNQHQLESNKTKYCDRQTQKSKRNVQLSPKNCLYVKF